MGSPSKTSSQSSKILEKDNVVRNVTDIGVRGIDAGIYVSDHLSASKWMFPKRPCQNLTVGKGPPTDGDPIAFGKRLFVGMCH